MPEPDSRVGSILFRRSAMQDTGRLIN